MNPCPFTPIFILLAASSPAAIIRLVTSIPVNSVYGVKVAWTVTHVREKCREVISPALAHFYSPCAPIFVLLIFWVCASLNHASPNTVFGQNLSSKAVAVDKVVFQHKTAAAFDGIPFAREVVGKKHLFAPAVASAQPSWASFSNTVSASYDGQSTELLPCSIYKSCSHLEVV